MNATQTQKLSEKDIPYMTPEQERRVALELSDRIFKSAVKLVQIHFYEVARFARLKTAGFPVSEQELGDALDVALDLLHVPECDPDGCVGECVRMPFRAESIRVIARANGGRVTYEDMARNYCAWVIAQVEASREAVRSLAT